MDFKEYTAKTVDDAITNATMELGITSDKLEYEVIEKGSAGFLGIGSKPAKIKARQKTEAADIANEIKEKVVKVSKEVKETKEAKELKEVKPVKFEKTEKVEKNDKYEKKSYNKEPKVEKVQNKTESKPSTLSNDEVERTTKEFLSKVFAAMGLNVEINVAFEEDCVNVDLSGDDMGMLIGKRGQTLDSLQYLLSLVINKENEGYLRVKLDTENYRERRRKTLENLARNIAFKVKRTKRPVSLEPMNPYERRVIHSALQNDRYVYTKSEGEEPFRHVVVMLKRS